MAWHVFTKRTAPGQWFSPAIPPLADRSPARNAEYSADGCWAEEHDKDGLAVVYVWMNDDHVKPGHAIAKAARKPTPKQLNP